MTNVSTHPGKSETDLAKKKIPSEKKKSWQINCNYVPLFSQHDKVQSVYVSASPPWPQKLTQLTKTSARRISNYLQGKSSTIRQSKSRAQQCTKH